MIYLVAILDVMIKVLEFIELEERINLQNNLNLIQNNSIALITIMNILINIIQLAIQVFENEREDKLHNLIKLMQQFR